MEPAPELCWTRRQCLRDNSGSARRTGSAPWSHPAAGVPSSSRATVVPGAAAARSGRARRASAVSRVEIMFAGVLGEVGEKRKTAGCWLGLVRPRRGAFYMPGGG